MTENGLFVLGEPVMQLHDILWAIHDGKNRGRSEGEENFGELLVTVGQIPFSTIHIALVSPSLRRTSPRIQFTIVLGVLATQDALLFGCRVV